MTEQGKKILSNLFITSISAEGKGIGRSEGKVVFTEFAVPGDVVDVELRKSKKHFVEGVVAEIKTSSAQRIKPQCSHFGICGGCKWQHINYDAQLTFKKKIVEDALVKIGKIDSPAIPDLLGAKGTFFYRNKLEFTFTDRRWLTEDEIKSGETFDHRNALGFHVPESFAGVIDIEKCYLQSEPSNQIRTAIKDFALKNGYAFFNLREQKGFLRNLMIRISSIGEILVLISFSENNEGEIYKLLHFVNELFPQITSLQYVINSKRNDSIYDLNVKTYKGKYHIIEKLGNYIFKIGAKSFFQTNSSQAKVLYDVVKEFAELKKTDTVYDLYTGVGSIAIYVSGLCKRVIGIEQIEDAIKDAGENAELNFVTNCSFYSGDVKLILTEEFISANGKPDVIITDPPRAGMHEDVVKSLLQAAAPKIVYVSCNPATQARDLQLLAEEYEVKKIQPVDMFPQTTHIENVVLLKLKG